MTIAARLVFKPRRAYRCGGHRAEIIGTHVSMFGMAEAGDKPYGMRLCIPCAQDTARAGDAKVAAALQVGGLL